MENTITCIRKNEVILTFQQNEEGFCSLEGIHEKIREYNGIPEEENTRLLSVPSGKFGYMMNLISDEKKMSLFYHLDRKQ